MSTVYKKGAVFQFDFQADVFQGRYRLVERARPTATFKRNGWIVEILGPDEAEEERIRAYAATPEGSNRASSSFCDAEAEIAERKARAGERTTFQFTSSKRYHDYF